jgi:phosphatidyl-myo-inositol dimannoside synthase
VTTLVVTNDFPPRIGGIESFVAAACGFLDHDVVVLTATAPGAEHLDRTLPYEVVRVPGPLLPTPRTGRRAVQLLQRFGATKVLFGAAAPLALLAPTLRAAGAKRIVALTHGHETWWARIPGPHRLLRRIGDEVDALSTISDFVADQITPALSPAGRTKLFRLPPPVELAVFRPAPVDEPERRRRCISVGRFVPRKGFDVLLTAWRLVLDGWRDPGTRPELILVGDGPRRAALERQVRRLGLGGQVRFTGALPPSGVVGHLQSADVFALPVRTRRAGLEPEGLGLAAIEAAACGLPVVVGRSGGTPETAQDGRTGYLVDPRDQRALAERLSFLLGDRRAAATMGARGRAFVADRFAADQARRQLRAALRLDRVPIRYPGG